MEFRYRTHPIQFYYICSQGTLPYICSQGTMPTIKKMQLKHSRGRSSSEFKEEGFKLRHFSFHLLSKTCIMYRHLSVFLARLVSSEL